MKDKKNTKPFSVIGVGSPIVDRLVFVSEDFLMDIEGGKGGQVPVDLPTLRAIVDRLMSTLLVLL